MGFWHIPAVVFLANQKQVTSLHPAILCHASSTVMCCVQEEEKRREKEYEAREVARMRNDQAVVRGKLEEEQGSHPVNSALVNS